MKRATFVFIGVIFITASVVLTQNKTEKETASIVKVDLKKQHLPNVLD
ncbi:hypothetical protein N7U66_14425 [Lacinutrix neustonica]|uniref:Uncharacterized protein n=1 Tax=Lacinutrix neustonica TaxID=2980107 RepID=A0A9E8MUR6_9FLAO|nr:hypothetical protein [Lacinutrix neustonica]WAC01284.1 hypothetical protein N7U66_14425 [Lacinutrix neustonica]